MNVNCNLVLSGGGTRGYAHVGVIKALYEKGIMPAAVSGVSAGALIGAFICDGFHPLEIEEIIIKSEPKLGFNFTHFWDSLLTFNAFTEILKKNLRSKTIEGLRLPLHIGVTNLNTGLHETITHGGLIEALAASAALPMVLPPVFINNIPYADGGVSNNLPAEPFLNSPYKTAGIHVNSLPPYNKQAGFMKGIDRLMTLAMLRSVLEGRQRCHVFIEPPELQNYQVFESKKSRQLIDVGYNYVAGGFDLSPLGR